MSTTYLQLADGKKFAVSNFRQYNGVADVTLVLYGVNYPTVQRWDGCTLVLGEWRFENVRAGITEVRIDNPLDDIGPIMTEYDVRLVLCSRVPTPDDTQEVDAIGKP